MSNWIESKFRVDYRNFDTLPKQVTDNLYEINRRIKGVEKIKRIKEQIEDLEYALEAETHLTACELLKNNVFPRFNGYSDFIGSGGPFSVDSNKANTFFELALVVQSTSYEDAEEAHKKFQYALNNFIWLFFDGCGTFDTNKQFTIDYDDYNYVYGSYNDAFPSQITYAFNTTNFKSGNSYLVEFSFYDIAKALDYQHLKSVNPEFSSNVSLVAPFESIRTCGFGQITCTVGKIENTDESGAHKVKDKLYISSFDPFEIAAFIQEKVAKEDFESES